jgi:hypothetical protein
MAAIHMTRRAWLGAIAVSASVLAWPVTTAGVGVAAAAAVSAPMNCASLTLTATPRVNAQNAPFETIKNTVTSCAATTETVRLTQRISGPFAPADAPSRTWVFTLAPGQIAQKVQHLPYSCCGTYTVNDHVTASGVVLATKSTSFTFA